MRHYNWTEIRRRLKRAMARVIDDDRYLIERGPSERAVVHRLAIYLQQEFQDWNVDCEYNRQGGGTDPKTVKHDGKEKPSRVFPDIIVHKRGPGPNLVVVEIKPGSRTKGDIDKDRSKLRLIAKEYDYTFAALITYATLDRTGPFYIERIEPISNPSSELRGGRDVEYP